MDYHPVFGPAPDVGLEVEIGAWEEDCNQYTVCHELVQAGQMDRQFEDGRHDWHCSCPTCDQTLRDVSFPVRIVAQRDASLPMDGVELISSPFPTHEVFVESFMNAYRIIGDHARWEAGRYDQRERNLSNSGLHVHAFSPGNVGEIEADAHLDLVSQAPRVMMGFIPELFTMACANNIEVIRPLNFRLPVADTGGHHQFLAIAGQVSNRSITSQNPLRLEWRFWEMPYNDPLYVRAAIYISASLTQALTRPKLSRLVMAQSVIHDWDRSRTDIDHILSQFSAERMKILTELMINGSSMKDDPVGSLVILDFLERIDE